MVLEALHYTGSSRALSAVLLPEQGEGRAVLEPASAQPPVSELRGPCSRDTDPQSTAPTHCHRQVPAASELVLSMSWHSHCHVQREYGTSKTRQNQTPAAPDQREQAGVLREAGSMGLELGREEAVQQSRMASRS